MSTSGSEGLFVCVLRGWRGGRRDVDDLSACPMLSRRAPGRRLFALSTVFSFLALAGAALGQPPITGCPQDGVVLQGTEVRLIEGDCEISGDISMSGQSVIGVRNARLVVRGSIRLIDDASLFVEDSTLIVDNEFSMQREILAQGRSRVSFTRTVFETSVGNSGSTYMAYVGKDDSILEVTQSRPASPSSWLLARMEGHSQVFTEAAYQLPSEIIIFESATIEIGPDSRTAVWFTFLPRSKAVLNLPDQTSGKYSFEFGRDTPGVENVKYQMRIIDATVRLHMMSSPRSDVVVHGRGEGLPGAGEISVGYYVWLNFRPVTITGLRPGFAAYRKLTDQRRNLELINVEIDPVGWNVYSVWSFAPVIVTDSIVNEIAAYSLGRVEVRNSILQFAVAGSVGSGGSMVVRDSHIFSQTVQTGGTSTTEIIDSVIHGSVLEATGSATLRVNGGFLVPNGPDSSCDFTTALSEVGVPRCNPFLAAGALPVVNTSGAGQVILNPSPPTEMTDLQMVGFNQPNPVSLGSPFTHSVRVGNAGPDDATGVKVRFETPQGAQVSSFSPQCSASGTSVLCVVGELAYGSGSTWLEVTYLPTSVGALVGEVTATGNEVDSEPSNHWMRFTTTVNPP